MAVSLDYRHDDRLASAVELVNTLPPLSPMVRRLLGTLSNPDEDASLSEIATWIEKDTLATGRVLALANSAYYYRAEPTLSVRQAVSRLGLNAIRKLVLSMFMGGFWSRIPMPAQWSTSRFNAHSIATAVLSEMIASMVSVENMESAFLAGLFHDVGQIVIAVSLRNDPDALARLEAADDGAREQLELELVGFSHPELSAAILRTWSLPTSIEKAVRFHEAPMQCSDSGVALSDIVHAADRYVDCEGLSISGIRRENGDKLTALNQLGLGMQDPNLFVGFREQLDTLLSLL
jgi:putative nucleotidyltransferase with HDIG domain